MNNFLLLLILFIFLFFFPSNSFAQSSDIVVRGFSITRGRFSLSQVNGNIPLPPPIPYFTSNLYANLHNQNNFGPIGKVSCEVDIAGMVNYIHPESLVDESGNLLVDIFFGNPIDTPLTQEEADELAEFVEAGGVLYITGMGWSTNTPGKGAEYNLLFETLGIEDRFNAEPFASGLIESGLPTLSPVTNGPFGTVGKLRHTAFRTFNSAYLLPVTIGGNSDEFIIHEGKIGRGYLVVTGEAIYINDFIGDTDNRTYYLNLFSLPCRDDWRQEEEDNSVVLDVPSFKQGLLEYDDLVPSWEKQTYDNGNELDLWCDTNKNGATMAECGCALSSASMVAKYHGVDLAPDRSSVNPETLNYYLRQNLDTLGAFGFYNGNINWYAVSNFSAQANKKLKEHFGESYNQAKLEQPVREDYNLERIKQLIDESKPVIIKVTGKWGIHWVVIKGYELDTNRLIINDPIKPDPASGEYTYLDENYTPVPIGSMIIYEKTNSDFRYLQFVTTSQNNILVSDQSGNEIPNLETAFDVYSGDATNEGELSSSEDAVNFITIKLPEDGIYNINVASNNGGLHPFAVYTSGEEGDLAFKSFMPQGNETDYAFLYNQETAGVDIVQVVDIEVRPFSNDKKINPESAASIPIAILSSNSFDTTKVTEETITAGASGSEESLHFCLQKTQDINGDDLEDKLCWFKVGKMDLNYLSTEVIIMGVKNNEKFIGKISLQAP